MTWAMADSRAGGGGVLDDVLVGDSPCYRVYPCAGGTALAAGTLEPKFWVGFVSALGLAHLAGDGLDTGPGGEAAAAEVEKALGTMPASHWVELGAKLGLPLSEVLPAAEAVKQEWIPAGAGSLRAPSLGNATERVLAEFGAEGDAR
jgi:crotonobetainyl-CoA:carnitine CoA-transferase CaiB-like acyl-CoA transferase